MAYTKILIIQKAIKLPDDVDVKVKNKAQKKFKKGDRIYFADGDVIAVPEEDIHVPEPNEEEE
jgi:ASC-1-like (ASCH) protein